VRGREARVHPVAALLSRSSTKSTRAPSASRPAAARHPCQPSGLPVRRQYSGTTPSAHTGVARVTAARKMTPPGAFIKGAHSPGRPGPCRARAATSTSGVEPSCRAPRARWGRCRRCDAAAAAARFARGRGADALPCPHPPRPARASFRFVLPLGLVALQARGRLRCAHALAAPAHAWRARAAGRPVHTTPAWRARLWALRSAKRCLRLARRCWRSRVRPDARVAPPCRAPQEDTLLRQLIAKHGARNWSVIANGIRGRSGKSCRLRWCNQLNPSVKKEPFSEEEDAKIVQASAARAPSVGPPVPVLASDAAASPTGTQGARKQVGNHRALAAGQVCHPPGDPRQTTTTDARGTFASQNRQLHQEPLVRAREPRPVV
jgi:hypothetical protein